MFAFLAYLEYLVALLGEMVLSIHICSHPANDEASESAHTFRSKCRQSMYIDLGVQITTSLYLPFCNFQSVSTGAATLKRTSGPTQLGTEVTGKQKEEKQSHLQESTKIALIVPY